MGIWNRDYMKRPPDEDDDSRGGSESDSKLEAFFARFLKRNPKFFTYAGIALGLLVIIALIVAAFSKSR